MRLIDADVAIDVFEIQLDYLQALNKDENPTAESIWYGVNWARNTIADLPSMRPVIKPLLDYRDCAEAMLKLWAAKVVTDEEYDNIMDRLNVRMGVQRR